MCFGPWGFGADGAFGVVSFLGSVLDIKEDLSGAVVRGILDRVLSSLGLPAWFQHVNFEYHVGVKFRFKLAAGLGEAWTRDVGIPQVCPS